MDINWKMWSKSVIMTMVHEKLSFPPQAKWEMKNQVCTFVIRIECNDMENSVDSTFDDAYQNGQWFLYFK